VTPMQSLRYIARPESRIQSRQLAAGSKVRLVSSLPKSGTWSLQYFWTTFNSLLQGREEADPFSPFWSFPAFGIDLMAVCHFYCPGLEGSIGPGEHARWSAIGPVVASLNWGWDVLSQFGEGPDPAVNPSCRVLLVRRNPLDQMVSYHRNYAADYKTPGYPYTVRDAEGRIIPADDLGSFSRNLGVNSIVKYLLSYRLMQERLGPQLLVLSYERMIRDREAQYRKMVEFFCDRLDPAWERPFSDAIELTSFERMAALEANVGGSLANPDFVSAYFLGNRAPEATYGRKHLNSGGIGAWKTRFRSSDVDWCLESLREHGIDPDQFEFE
jgi:hypothetical protein